MKVAVLGRGNVGGGLADLVPVFSQRLSSQPLIAPLGAEQTTQLAKSLFRKLRIG